MEPAVSSDVFLVQRADTAEPVPLLICFSSVGAKTFTLYRLTQALPCDRIYIRDPELKAWFQKGIISPEGHLDDVLDLVARVRRENQPVYCVGSSMGGYAAMYYGLKLGATRVLAMIPQISLWQRLPRTPERDIRLVVPTLEKMLASSHETEINIVFGEDDLVDLYQMSLLPRNHPRVICHAFAGEGHPLAASLNKNNLLATILQDFVSNQPLTFADRPACRLEDFSPYQIETANRLIPLYYLRKYDEALAAWQLCLEAHPDWALGYMWLAKSAEKANADKDLMWKAIHRAMELHPGCPDFHYEAARMAHSHGDPAKSRKHLEDLFKLSSDYKIGVQLLATLDREAAEAQSEPPHA